MCLLGGVGVVPELVKDIDRNLAAEFIEAASGVGISLVFHPVDYLGPALGTVRHY
jgi:hypothetical protein